MLEFELHKINDWIFDLDNTLYSPEFNLQAEISKRMGDYIMISFDLKYDDAKAMQKQYFQQYGTTLRGLMENHDIDPNHYLDFVHDLDYSCLQEDKELELLLSNLPGRKFIHSNGDDKHCVNVMERLGISHCFNGIFDIIASDFIPKPNQAPYFALQQKYDIMADQAIMFEDIAVNLKIPYEMGYKTIFVSSHHHPDDVLSHHHQIDHNHIHSITPDVKTFLYKGLKG